MGKHDYYIEKRSDRTEFFYQQTESRAVATRAHIHDSIELLYVRVGSFTVYLDDRTYELSEGDLILFCSNSIHRVVSGAGEKNGYFVIKVNPTVLHDFEVGASFLMRFAVSRKDSRCVWRREELQGTALCDCLDALIKERECGDRAPETAMRIEILRLLLLIFRDGKEPPQSDDGASSEEIAVVIYNAIVYIRQHFPEDVSAAALAAKMGVSYSYFSRSFGRIAGRSFKEYLNLTRVNYAERLLLTTGKSVTEIAAECGYNNVSYFISVYRRIKGTTPRRTARNDPSSGLLTGGEP